MRKEITRYLHDAIFNHLSSLHQEDPKFLFRLRRSNRYDRLTKGFWFHGNEKYLALSFWAGSDWLNKTPNISFVFEPEGRIYLQLTGRDSKEKTKFFKEEFYKKMDGFGEHKDKNLDEEIAKYDNSTLYIKELDFEWDLFSIEETLDIIIEEYKEEIDKKVNKWLTSKDGKNQSTNPLGNIDISDFRKLKKRVEKYQWDLRSQEILENPSALATETFIFEDKAQQKEREKKLKEIIETLDISINRIKIKRYKDIKNVDIKGIDNKTQWVFISGENGNGKTSILEAIAIGLNSNYDENLLLHSHDFELSVNVNYYGAKQKNEVRPMTIESSIGDFKQIVEFVTYGPNRFDISSTPSTSDINLKSKTYNLFHGNGKLLNIEDELVKWDLKAKLYFNGLAIEDLADSDHPNTFHNYEKYFDIFDKVRNIFLGSTEDNFGKGLLPSVIELGPDMNKDDDLIYYSIGKNKKAQTQKKFAELSTGNKSLVAMIGDLILRFLEYYGTNEEDMFADPSEFRGIVIIDEIDAHIHPKWQYSLPRILSELFPQLQFIVSCHSPIPMMGVPDYKRAQFIKMYRDDKFNIKAEKLDYMDLYNLTPETILTSPIFDFDQMYETDDPEMRLSSEKDYSDEVFNRILKDKLSELASKIKSDEKDN